MVDTRISLYCLFCQRNIHKQNKGSMELYRYICFLLIFLGHISPFFLYDNYRLKQIESTIKDVQSLNRFAIRWIYVFQVIKKLKEISY